MSEYGKIFPYKILQVLHLKITSIALHIFWPLLHLSWLQPSTHLPTLIQYDKLVQHPQRNLLYNHVLLLNWHGQKSNLQVQKAVSTKDHLHLQQKLVQADQFSPIYSFPSSAQDRRRPGKNWGKMMALSPLFLSNNAFSWVTKRKARTRGYWVVVGWDKHGIYHGVSWLYLAPFLANGNIILVVIFPSHNGTTLFTTAIHEYEIPNLHTRMDQPIHTWHSRCWTRSHHHHEQSMPCENLRFYCNNFVSRTQQH